jgi:hypothetical protein
MRMKCPTYGPFYVAVACLLVHSGTTGAVTILPGTSALLDYRAATPGSVLASVSHDYVDATTDIFTRATFTSEVLRSADGALRFRYGIAPVDPNQAFLPMPGKISLYGFYGVSTDISSIAVVQGAPGETPMTVSRSKEGVTLTITFPQGVNPPGNRLLFEVLTDNNTHFHEDGFVILDYVGYSNAPGEQNLPFPFSYTFPDFAPVPGLVVPEPLSLLTLPLAVGALAWRFRRRA